MNEVLSFTRKGIPAMKHNITIKDVAKEAGVSVATVSYVINNHTEKRISEKTKKKVLQVVNLLNYTPNQSAKALATKRNQMIALYLSPDMSVLKNAEQLHFIHFLSSFLHEHDYDLIYLSNNYTQKFDHADAIVCYDISSDLFHQIGDCNFVPLLSLDCQINDPLCFQINSDYERSAKESNHFFKGAPYTLLSLATENIERKNYLSTLFPDIVFVHDIWKISNYKSKNILVVDETLYQLLNNTNHVYYAPLITTPKFEILLQCIEYALQRIPIEQHDVRV